jgi:hypothetical protein
MWPASTLATPKPGSCPWTTVLMMGRASRGGRVKIGANDNPDWPPVAANLLPDPKDTK